MDVVACRESALDFAVPLTVAIERIALSWADSSITLASEPGEAIPDFSSNRSQ
jgi:hypothetical protein